MDMRKVKIIHDEKSKGFIDEYALQNVKGEYIHCALDRSIACYPQCAWFNQHLYTIHLRPSGSVERMGCYCGEKEIGELIDV